MADFILRAGKTGDFYFHTAFGVFLCLALVTLRLGSLVDTSRKQNHSWWALGFLLIAILAETIRAAIRHYMVGDL